MITDRLAGGFPQTPDQMIEGWSGSVILQTFRTMVHNGSTNTGLDSNADEMNASSAQVGMRYTSVMLDCINNFLMTSESTAALK